MSCLKNGTYLPGESTAPRVWAQFGTVISLSADYEIEFCWQKENNGAGDETRVLTDGSVDLLTLRDSDHSAPDSVAMRLNSDSLVTWLSALDGIAIGEFVKIRLRRIGPQDTELFINDVSQGIRSPEPSGATFVISTMGAPNSSLGLDSIISDLKITDLTSGDTWEYTNRDDTGAQLTDSGPAANHGTWIQAGTPMTDAEADAARVTISVNPDPIEPPFFRLWQHLLPRARAWFLTPTKTLRDFFVGLSGWPENVKTFYDGIFNDLFPQHTRELDEWEQQFALPDVSGLTEQQRRDRLAGAWAATGGQSPSYIQGVLQAAGFDAYVHEWWEPVAGRSGGAVGNETLQLVTEDGDNIVTEDGDSIVSVQTLSPVARNPFNYLASGAVVYIMNDGGADAQDGGEQAMDGATSGATGYPLVNRPEFTTPVIPIDEDKWRYFLYIGGENFPDHASVQGSRRDEFETLCLKISPVQQWLGMLIDYV